jgi:hypothetical protein
MTRSLSSGGAASRMHQAAAASRGVAESMPPAAGTLQQVSVMGRWLTVHSLPANELLAACNHSVRHQLACCSPRVVSMI